jgi:hypothetical protein
LESVDQETAAIPDDGIEPGMVDAAGLRLWAERHDDLAIPLDPIRLVLKTFGIDVKVPWSV